MSRKGAGQALRLGPGARGRYRAISAQPTDSIAPLLATGACLALVQEETACRKLDRGAHLGRCHWSCRYALGIAACSDGTRARATCQSFRARKSAPDSRADEQSCRLRCLSARPRVSRLVAPRGCDSIIPRGSEVGSQFCAGLGISLHWAERELLARDRSKPGAAGGSQGCPRSRAHARSSFTGNSSCSRLLPLLRTARFRCGAGGIPASRKWSSEQRRCYRSARCTPTAAWA